MRWPCAILFVIVLGGCAAFQKEKSPSIASGMMNCPLLWELMADGTVDVFGLPACKSIIRGMIESPNEKKPKGDEF